MLYLCLRYVPESNVMIFQELLEQMLEVNRGKVPELVDLLLSSESTELSEQERYI